MQLPKAHLQPSYPVLNLPLGVETGELDRMHDHVRRAKPVTALLDVRRPLLCHLLTYCTSFDPQPVTKVSCSASAIDLHRCCTSITRLSRHTEHLTPSILEGTDSTSKQGIWVQLRLTHTGHPSSRPRTASWRPRLPWLLCISLSHYMDQRPAEMS